MFENASCKKRSDIIPQFDVVDTKPRRGCAVTGITSDPNDPADEQFIVRLIERVTAVSLSTVKLLKDLPSKIEFVGLNTVEKAEALKVAP